MLFKSMGVALATRTSNISDDLKPITLRMPEKEVQLYDAVSKTMGLNRQDFLIHLIRNSFKESFKEFVIGYSQSSPTVPLIDLLFSNTDDKETHQTLHRYLTNIVEEVHHQDEIALHEDMKSSAYNSIHDSPMYTEPMKGILKND
jgi:hypothetical protein